ncbi:MAG: peptidoglycan-binding protein [Clostridiales bacterium GWF2_36_10]|nr:MAG: peptidoglycan-binding protein [Clostridiales bacterium GWF2_36_10]HAN20456.1 peptidoglycan-binding protein [Clostridiales bacterium]
MKRMKKILLTTVMLLSLSLFFTFNASAATYTTVSGDSLYKIGQVFNTSTTTLMKDNNLTSTMLKIGQKLYVNCNTYTVEKGDNLYAISRQYGITLSALRRANNIYTDLILIGQVLNIPQATTTAATPVSNTSVYSTSDRNILARLITAEAQGESYEAKVAVGAVVMNRVKSPLWPNTISGVIYQNINGYYQFSPVENGSINNVADADSIKAANVAMSGVDPTNGAMFYYDTSTTNAWILAKPVSISIDNMVFAY